MQVRMQDQASIGVALPFGGVNNAVVPQTFQTMLQQIEADAPPAGSVPSTNAPLPQPLPFSADQASASGPQAGTPNMQGASSQVASQIPSDQKAGAASSSKSSAQPTAADRDVSPERSRSVASQAGAAPGSVASAVPQSTYSQASPASANDGKSLLPGVPAQTNTAAVFPNTMGPQRSSATSHISAARPEAAGPAAKPNQPARAKTDAQSSPAPTAAVPQSLSRWQVAYGGNGPANPSIPQAGTAAPVQIEEATAAALPAASSGNLAISGATAFAGFGDAAASATSLPPGTSASLDVVPDAPGNTAADSESPSMTASAATGTGSAVLSVAAPSAEAPPMLEADTATQLAAPTRSQSTGPQPFERASTPPSSKTTPSLNTRPRAAANLSADEQLNPSQPALKPKPMLWPSGTNAPVSHAGASTAQAATSNATESVVPAASPPPPGSHPSSPMQASSAVQISDAVSGAQQAIPEGGSSAPATAAPAKAQGPTAAPQAAATTASDAVAAPSPTLAATIVSAGHGTAPAVATNPSQTAVETVASAPAPAAGQRASTTPSQNDALQQPGAPASEANAAQAPALTHARLVQSLNGSQMQVTLSTEEFGRISVHAGYGRDSLTAQISLESSQLGTAITAHLPAAEQRLAGEHGLRTSISVANSLGGQTSGEGQTGAEGRNRNANTGGPRSSPTAESLLNNTDAQLLSVTASSSTTTATPAISGRLNIRI